MRVERGHIGNQSSVGWCLPVTNKLEWSFFEMDETILRAVGLPDESEGKFPSLPNESEQREVKPPTCHACTVEGAWCLE